MRISLSQMQISLHDQSVVLLVLLNGASERRDNISMSPLYQHLSWLGNDWVKGRTSYETEPLNYIEKRGIGCTNVLSELWKSVVLRQMHFSQSRQHI